MLSLFWVQNHKCRSARPVNVHIIRSQKKPTWEHCNVFHQGKAITLHKKLVLVILRSTCTLWRTMHLEASSISPQAVIALPWRMLGKQHQQQLRSSTSGEKPEKNDALCNVCTLPESHQKQCSEKKNKKFLTFFTWRSPKVSPAETFERSDCLRS